MRFADALARDPEPAEVVDGLAVERLDGVAILTLARPKAYNAFDRALWERLNATLAELAGDPSLAAVVLRGAGGRAFAAGADIAEFPELRTDVESAAVYNRRVDDALRGVMALPVPVIAMIGGLAVGGGCELACACDVRIAGDRARLGLPLARLGVILGLAETRAVVRHTGPHNLKYLLFSGKLVDAGEALRRGLVDEVVPSDELAAAVSSLLESILAGSAATIRAAKLVTDMATRAPSAEDGELLARLEAEAYGGDDLKEGVAAFLAKRPPAFPSRRG